MQRQCQGSLVKDTGAPELGFRGLNRVCLGSRTFQKEAQRGPCLPLPQACLFLPLSSEAPSSSSVGTQLGSYPGWAPPLKG